MHEKRLFLPLLLSLAAVGATASTLAAATASRHGAVAERERSAAAERSARVDPRLTRRLRTTARRWEIVMGRRPVRSRAALDTRRALRFWRSRRRRVLRLAAHPPHKLGWLCIHRFEASWGDSGDPYWGGLQMSRSFMNAYAPRLLLRRGLADRWSALEQMWVAERAHRSGRGYWPWANTARACGLL